MVSCVDLRGWAFCEVSVEVWKMRSQIQGAGPRMPISRGYFLMILAVFDPFWQFRFIFGGHFSLLMTFGSPRYGILDPRMPPCVVAHPKRVFKPARW
jgi:hypothetical protein